MFYYWEKCQKIAYINYYQLFLHLVLGWACNKTLNCNTLFSPEP